MSKGVTQFKSKGDGIRTCACQKLSKIDTESKIINPHSCQACVLAGKSSCLYCVSMGRTGVYSKIKKIMDLSCAETSYKFNRLDTDYRNNNDVLVEKNFTYLDECGVQFTRSKNQEDLQSSYMNLEPK